MGSINKVYTLLLVTIISISSLLITQSVKAEVENVSTSCGIFVDSIVEEQPVTVVVQIFPAPPSGEVFNNLTVWMTSPMQGVWGNGGNGPWSKGHISTDTSGRATVTFDIITFGGYWNIGLYFEGQYYVNNTIYYQPGNWQTGFTVSPVQTPIPSPTVTPYPSPSPTPITTLTPAPSIPEFPATLGITLFVMTILSLLLVLRRKHSSQ
jgi:hypothetical protein